MRKITMNTDTTSDRFRPITVFYWLFILAGLGIPVLIFIFTYSPILTDNLASLLAYAEYLAENGSHISADGWISTGGFFPLSPEFFLTFFISSSIWKDALYNASICCYIVYSVSVILFTVSLRARKLITYILCALFSLAAGLYGLFAVSGGSFFISYISALLLLAGIIVNCIKIRATAKTKYICYATSAVIISASLAITFAIAGTNNRKIFAKTTLKNAFSYPLFNSKILTDKEASVQGLADYLSSSNINLAYSTEDISNIISIVTNHNTHTARIDVPTLEIPADMTNCRQATYDELAVNTGKIYFIAEAGYTGPFNDYFIYAEKEYSDEYYSIYSYANRKLITDDTLRSDMFDICNGDYDTFILSMTDISTAEISELYTTKRWKAYTPKHIFSDSEYFNNYSAAILRRSPDRIILYIDPFILYDSVDYDKDAYMALIRSNYESIIKNNPQVIFPLIFQSYHINHYKDYSDADFIRMYQAYEYFVDIIEPYSNVTYNYYGYIQYIYENPYIYEAASDQLLKPDAANNLMLETLADESHRVNTVWLLNFVSQLIDIAGDYPYSAAADYDLSDTTIVIFGDSIFGNYTGSTSIQQVISDYSGANVICRAVGGASATSSGKAGYQLEDQMNIGEINSELNSSPSDNRLVFILEFGLNDYFEGYPVNNKKAPNSPDTFCGALRTAISTIKENWPQGEIILMAPGYINYYSYGEAPMSESGRILSEYRNAVISLAQENKCRCINLTDIGITTDALGKYLLGDFVHYNEEGRYYVGRYMLDYLCGYLD